MPLIDPEMNEEEMESLLNPAPKGNYLLKLWGFRTDEDGNPVFVSEKGGKYVKASFQIAEDGPHRGKFGDYFAMKQSRNYALLLRAIPGAVKKGVLDTDLAVGMECRGDVDIDEYEGNLKNVVKKVYPLAGEPQEKAF